jgi:DNA-binding winged helix-turn-helix (wHTH) protein
MIHRFGAFELDDEQRELRLDGEGLRVQPLVFDLLAFLVANRDRVVPKGELLETLWPDAIVVEGALQRAVSVARSVLRRGGMEGAIRTYPRRGYRFCADVRAASPSAAPAADLARAREAFERGEWAEAFDQFAKADRERALEAPDLALWAQAAPLAGRLSDSILPLERAVAASRLAGDLEGAAGAAIMLAHMQFDRREVAVAQGWFNRAKRLLDRVGECSATGLLEWMAARMALTRGELNAALAHAQVAYDIGRRLENPDLEGLGMDYRGLALQALGEVERGVALQDEAAALVLSGEVRSWAGGIIYCGVIWGCINRGDWQRAAQWTDQFSRWCERTRMSNFPGVCRMHRAEVLSVVGDLGEAEKEIREACDTLARSAPWAEGDAWRVMGDIHLSRGELDDADKAFRRAHELGWDPQPGFSLLQVARGNADAALRGLERALDGTQWAHRQKRGLLLAHLVTVAIAAGERSIADRALAELDAHPELHATPSHSAFVAQARASVARADGDLERAVAWLRAAIAIWLETGSSLNVVRVRLKLAEILCAMGDVVHAELELSAAESVLATLENEALATVCRAIRRNLER